MRTFLLFFIFLTTGAASAEGDFSVSTHGDRRLSHYSVGMAPKAKEALKAAQSRGKRVDVLSFTSAQNWILVAEDEVIYSDRRAFEKRKLGNSDLPAIIDGLVAETRVIDEIVFAPFGEWIVQSGDRIIYSNESMFDATGLRPKLAEIAAGNDVIQSISVGPNNEWVIIAGGRAHASKVADGMAQILSNAMGIEKRMLVGAWYRPGRKEWIVLTNNGYWASKPIENRIDEGFRQLHRQDSGVNVVALEPGNGVALISSFPVPKGNFSDQLERSLAPSSRRSLNIRDVMESEKVAGMAVAVIRNNSIESVRGYGRRRGSKGFVDYETIFSAASMSKAVAAFGIANAVDDGILDWDITITEIVAKHPGTLIADWSDAVLAFRPDDMSANGPVFPDRLELIRLRDLLTHTAGLNRWGIGLWPLGKRVTYRDILFGNRVYRDDGLLRPIRDPQAERLYSGGGYTLAEMMLQLEAGQPFGQFMHDNVLRPLGMTNSTFGSLNDTQKKEQLAYGHNRDRRPIDYRESPGKAAGGLYTTAEDYARFVLALMNDGRSPVSGQKLLSLGPFLDMMLPLRRFRGSCSSTADCSFTGEQCSAGQCRSTITDRNGNRFGMGLVLSASSNSRGRPAEFWHGGTQEGYRAFFKAEPETGSAIVILVNTTSSWLTVVPGVQRNRKDTSTCMPLAEWNKQTEWIRLSMEFREVMAEASDPPCDHKYQRRGANRLIDRLSRGFFALDGAS